MKVFYIHQYFNTPQEPGGTRSYWFAKELINAGHEVIMFTSGRKGQLRFTEKKNIEGIEVIYVRNPYDNKMGLLSRLWSFIKFMSYAVFFGLQQKNVDIIYATSTPLSVGFPALVINWLKGTRYVFEVRDLWPEVPIQMGAFKNKILIKFLRWFEKKIYQNASHVVALSPGMKEGVLQCGIAEDKVSMIPNMSKKDEFYIRDKNPHIAEQFGISLHKFIAIHFGTMGMANGLQYIVDAAGHLQKNNINNIEIIFLGGGSTEDELKKICEQNQLSNIRFLGKHKMKIVSEIVNISDVSIVTFLDLPILYTNSPNKLFDSLSAAKPLIVNSAGWTKDMVEENECGVYVDPKKPEDLATCLVNMSQSPDLLQKMSANSRNLAESTYDKSILCKQFLKVMETEYSKIKKN